jgi:hypothetical protein
MVFVLREFVFLNFDLVFSGDYEKPVLDLETTGDRAWDRDFVSTS